MPGEDAYLSDFAPDLVTRIRSHEEPPQTLRGHVHDGALAVNRLSRSLDGSVAHVRTEHLDSTAKTLRFQEFGQRDRHRIYFFAAGASRNPGSDRMGLLTVLH